MDFFALDCFFYSNERENQLLVIGGDKALLNAF